VDSFNKNSNESRTFLFIGRRDKSVPRHAGLLLKAGGSAWRGRNRDEMAAFGALNLPTRMLFVALKMLVTTRTRKFEFGHRINKIALCLIVPFYAYNSMFATRIFRHNFTKRFVPDLIRAMARN
jgi:hypothetical protein